MAKGIFVPWARAKANAADRVSVCLGLWRHALLSGSSFEHPGAAAEERVDKLLYLAK